jgi:hypothetical protein
MIIFILIANHFTFTDRAFIQYHNILILLIACYA